ncbi:MbeD/MobD family mobilization/exclusion protein [Candidatus Palauibacter sp.]|uniref:MbeD/MobD family mobilization/exclusion protein n=1 Tax=Candidatus Palauibacter sp. TaxID=3101350 RepID=UPI003B52C30C
MNELERQLTAALKRLSEQYETEQRRHSGQVEALRRHVERLSAENDTLRRQIERLNAQVTRLKEYYGTSAAARPRGHGW